MVDLGLLEQSDDGKRLRRAEGGTVQAGQINLLARFLLNTLERYYITLAVLAKNGSGTLNRPELEQLCIQTAQRITAHPAARPPVSLPATPAPSRPDSRSSFSG